MHFWRHVMSLLCADCGHDNLVQKVASSRLDFCLLGLQSYLMEKVQRLIQHFTIKLYDIVVVTSIKNYASIGCGTKLYRYHVSCFKHIYYS